MMLLLTDEEAAVACNALVAAEAVLCEALAHGNGDGRTLRDMMSETRTLRERIERTIAAEHRRELRQLVEFGRNRARCEFLLDVTRGHGDICPCTSCKELRAL